jgi:hypothetical protein
MFFYFPVVCDLFWIFKSEVKWHIIQELSIRAEAWVDDMKVAGVYVFKLRKVNIVSPLHIRGIRNSNGYKILIQKSFGRHNVRNNIGMEVRNVGSELVKDIQHLGLLSL